MDQNTLIDSLLETLTEADSAYYNTGVAKMSDAEYDVVRASLENLRGNERVDKYLSGVGAKPPAHLARVKHSIHMGSQAKANSLKDLQDWVSKKGVSGPFCVSYKMDGSSVQALYVDGALRRVSSRGDGIEGSDITKNALLWGGLPKTIDARGIIPVRGEVILLKSLWKEHFPGMANPRNAGNGKIMQKEPDGNQHMMFFAFDADFPSKTQARRFEILSELGFSVTPHQRVHSITALADFFNQTVVVRDSIDYEIDGLIVAVDDLSVQRDLGYSDGGSRPNGQIAWKFEAQSVETVVSGVTLTQGHTGAIIPTAKLEPVKVGGITVSNCLLNNFEFIKELGLNIGDVVEVERAGDVIPYITKVVEKRSEGVYEAPSHCPFCQSDLKVDGKAVVCVSEDCSGKQFQLIRNWVNKTNIKFLGDNLLETLYEEKVVTSIVDLYRLTTLDLEDVKSGAGRLGGSMATKIIKEIDQTKNLPIDLFMGSLGIKFLGRSMVNHIGLETPNDFFEISEADLANKPEMGVNKARMMKASISSKESLIKELLGHIKVTEKAVPEKPLNGSLSGKSFVFTGVRLTQPEKDRLTELGGTEKSSVSSGVSYLVQKDESSTSSKSEKAKSLGVQVISINAFRDLIA